MRKRRTRSSGASHIFEQLFRPDEELFNNSPEAAEVSGRPSQRERFSDALLQIAFHRGSQAKTRTTEQKERRRGQGKSCTH